LAYTKATLYYMSGTGNTFRAAKWISEEAARRGVRADLIGIEHGRPESEIADGDGRLVGLLMPTHAFTAPWRMIRFACGLPRRKRTHAFVEVTRGGTKFGSLRLPGFEGTACYLIALIMALKGYRVRGVIALDMPTNWLQVHPGFSPEAARDMASRAKPKAERFIGRILSGETHFSIGGFISLFIGLLLLPVSLGYLLWARFFLPKLFFASNRCNGCGQCAAECPFRAIRMPGGKKPRPYWTWRCESCMRCMAYCPVKAIEAGHSWGVLLYYISYLPLALWIFSGVVSPAVTAYLDNGWVRLIVQYIYYLAAICLAYSVFNLLIRIPFINTLFTYTTLTRIFPRYHEPDTDVHEM